MVGNCADSATKSSPASGARAVKNIAETMPRAMTVNFRSVFIVRFSRVNKSVVTESGCEARPTDVGQAGLYVSSKGARENATTSELLVFRKWRRGALRSACSAPSTAAHDIPDEQRDVSCHQQNRCLIRGYYRLENQQGDDGE